MLAYLMIYCMLRNNFLVHVKQQKENFIIEKCNLRGIRFEQKLYVSMAEHLPFDLSINSASPEVMLSSAKRRSMVACKCRRREFGTSLFASTNPSLSKIHQQISKPF